MQVLSVTNPPAPRDDYYRALEDGGVLLFPSTPFAIPDRDYLTRVSGTGKAYHKNIAYKPAQDALTGYDKTATDDAAKLKQILRAYSQSAIDLVSTVLPRYRQNWRVDYASFRPEEEEGRDLPWKKRNDLLHVDSFPSRPTNGALIMRVFTNVNPEKSRVWLTAPPFSSIASQYARAAGLDRIASEASSPVNGIRRVGVRALQSLGARVPDRSPYDRFMLGFHDYLKSNGEFQSGGDKFRTEFPPGATWMVFTDIVPHAVLSGRFALEQTFIIARESLLDPAKAPASILERLSGATLTYGAPRAAAM